MGIYLYNYLSLPIYRMLIKNRKMYCVMVSIQLFLILACRDVTVGADLAVYMSGYNYIKGLSFFDMLTRLNLFMTADLEWPYTFESGYVLFNWIVARLGISFHGFLIVCAAVNIISIGVFIYRYSKMPELSFSMFVALGMYTYCFGILRQSLALSVLLWSVPYVLKHDKLKVAIYVLVAFMFHRISIIFIFLILLYEIKITKNKYIFWGLVSFGMMILSPFLYKYIFVKLLTLLGKTVYSEMNFHLNGFMIMMLFIYVMIYSLFNIRMLDNFIMRLSCWGFFVSMLMEIFALSNEIINRGLEVVFVFVIILLPNLFSSYKETQSRKIMVSVTYVFFLLFLIYNVIDSPIVPYSLYHNTLR